MNFNIDEILNKLNRPFVSEDDFKFELAWTIKETYKDYNIRLEYSPKIDPSLHYDILVIIDNDKWIPIELKYKPKEEIIKIYNEEFVLKNQGGHTDNCYKIIKDIERLERTKKLLKNTNIKFLEGYSITITNDSKYLTNTYNPYSLINKTTIKTNPTDKYPISLDNEYYINWKPYLNNSNFYILTIKVEGENNV